jgi:phosphoenolpyruvate carboxykinase (GTP)
MKPSSSSPTQAPPTNNKHLIRWVEKMADLCQPDSINRVDGARAVANLSCGQLVDPVDFMP